MSCSNRFCGERGKRGSRAAKVRGPWQRNVVLINFNHFYGGLNVVVVKRKQWEELGEKVKHDKKNPQIVFLGHNIKKINTFIF